MSYITNSTTGIQYKNRDCVKIQWMLRSPLTNDKQNKTNNKIHRNKNNFAHENEIKAWNKNNNKWKLKAFK